VRGSTNSDMFRFEVWIPFPRICWIFSFHTEESTDNADLDERHSSWAGNGSKNGNLVTAAGCSTDVVRGKTHPKLCCGRILLNAGSWRLIQLYTAPRPGGFAKWHGIQSPTWVFLKVSWQFIVPTRHWTFMMLPYFNKSTIQTINDYI